MNKPSVFSDPVDFYCTYLILIFIEPKSRRDHARP